MTLWRDFPKKRRTWFLTADLTGILPITYWSKNLKLALDTPTK
jgi:hypothetical protein